MKIEIGRLNDAFNFEATNEQGKTILMDASPDIGGSNLGFRPMQLMLTSVGACSSIDIVNILKKQKQNLKDIKITIDGEREKDVIPSLFTDINVHFHLIGDLDEDKVKKAIDLSVNKYCSAWKTLEKSGAKMSYSYKITAE
jgi:putative redox protein